MFCLPLEKERKREVRSHVDAASTCWPQGEVPNAAMNHFLIDPVAVPVDAKKVVKSPHHT